MQSTHATTSARSPIGPPHAAPPGTVAAGQVAGNPIAAGVRSSGVPHVLSGPPQAPQIAFNFFASALAMASTYLPSATAGGTQSSPWLPRTRASQHFWSALLRAVRKAIVAFPSVVSKFSWNLVFRPDVAVGKYALCGQDRLVIDGRLNPPKP